jgi:LuxR family transcriptional regulator, maltose regulon positive regulatory protein
VVARPRLVGRLSEAREAPFVLLVAPAGYGKTTLLSEWSALDGRRFAWMELDERNGDPRRLLASATRTMHEGQPPTVLVVDNAHAITSPEAFEALEVAVRSMPGGSQIVLASRCEPGLPVGSLRARRSVVELRAGDLAMTHSEADALLGAAGIRLSEGGIDQLMRRTEGWPAGIYLAALSLRAQPDVDAALSSFAGDDQVVADYLRDEVLARLAPEHVTFLMHSSVLGTLSGSLCDAVLGRTGSGEMLAKLARANVLLVSLNRAGTSYRYHTLFAEMLRAELRRLEPERESALHARASAWHAERGDVDSAIHHAVAAGDPEQSGALLLRHVSSYIGHGRNDALQDWLGRFTDDQLATVPSLAVTAAHSGLAAGNRETARHWAAAATRGRLRGTGDAPRALEAASVLLRAAIAEHGLAKMGRDAVRARALVPDDSGPRSFALLLAGTAHHLAGNRRLARVELEDAVHSSAVAAPHVQALGLAQLALVEIDDADWEAAAVLIERARSRVEGCGLSGYPSVALVHAVSALARSHAGSAEDAHIDLRASMRLTGHLVDFIPWYDAETCVVLTRAALGMGDVPEARKLLVEAARLTRRTSDSPTLRGWLADARSQLDAATGSASDGLMLTAAERRVLWMLPTHLSFPAIAARLFVSTNTVKTHVRALYRKLDASSRSEAVSKATSAGLLEGLRAA